MRGDNAMSFHSTTTFWFVGEASFGKHSSPETVTHRDEMHGTKEGPDVPIKTRSVNRLSHTLF